MLRSMVRVHLAPPETPWSGRFLLSGAGIVVPPGNASRLTAAMKTLLDPPSQAAYRSAAAEAGARIDAANAAAYLVDCIRAMRGEAERPPVSWLPEASSMSATVRTASATLTGPGVLAEGTLR